MKKLFVILGLLIANTAFAVFPPCTTPGQLWREGNKTYECSVSGSWIEIDTDNHENIIRYGAICDGTTDNTTAIQNAIDAAAVNGRIVYVPPCDSTYDFASQITNVNVVPFMGNGILNFTGSGEDAFVWGDTSTFHKYNSTVQSEINIKRNSVDYTDQYSGVVFNQVQAFKGTISVEDFWQGLRLYATNSGNVFNDIKVGKFIDNVRAITLEAENTGWVNQNYFWGGEVVVDSSVNTPQVVRGYTLDASGDNIINGNIVIGTDLEVNNQAANGCASLYFEGSQEVRGNKFIGIRGESASVNYGLIGGVTEAYGNEIKPYYWDDLLDSPLYLPNATGETWQVSNNKISTYGNNAVWDNKKVLGQFNRGNLTESTSGFWAHSTGVWFDAVSSGNVTTAAVDSAVGMQLLADAIELVAIDNKALGFRIDASEEALDEQRKIWVLINFEGNQGGRINYQPFDSGSNPLVGDQYIPDRLFFRSTGLYASDDDIGRAAVPGLTITPLYIHPDVDHFYVGARGGTANSIVKDFKVLAATDSRLKVVKDANQVGIDTTFPVSNEIPTDTTAVEGQFVLNSEPSDGEVQGWVYDGASWVIAGGVGTAVTQYWERSGADLRPLTDGDTVTVFDGTAVGSATMSVDVNGYLAIQNSGNKGCIGTDCQNSSSGTSSNCMGFECQESNTQSFSNCIGTECAESNTGSVNNCFGAQCAQNNTGSEGTFIGHQSGQNNTAASVAALGQRAARENIGVALTCSGYRCGEWNRGDFSTGHGRDALNLGAGEDNTGVGYTALQYSEADDNTALGSGAFGSFQQDSGSAGAFLPADVNTGTDRITVTGHGWGGAGVIRNLLITSTGTVPAPMTSGLVYQFEIIDGNTVEALSVNITGQGTGNHTLTPQFVYTNSTAIGSGAQPDASDQVMLGSPNVQEVKTYGGVIPGFVTSDPCGTFPEGAIFYNDTSNYHCYCDQAGADLKMSDNTACF